MAAIIWGIEESQQWSNFTLHIPVYRPLTGSTCEYGLCEAVKRHKVKAEAELVIVPRNTQTSPNERDHKVDGLMRPERVQLCRIRQRGLGRTHSSACTIVTRVFSLGGFGIKIPYSGRRQPRPRPPRFHEFSKLPLPSPSIASATASVSSAPVFSEWLAKIPPSVSQCASSMVTSSPCSPETLKTCLLWAVIEVNLYIMLWKRSGCGSQVLSVFGGVHTGL
ncbi:hypothetical protein JB92DRAFT_2824566 [Gautieria morchelliformis]|nr:hypothetical protein JB92DRAFT_2824566 [Gautieria morchelliformis]